MSVSSHLSWCSIPRIPYRPLSITNLFSLEKMTVLNIADVSRMIVVMTELREAMTKGLLVLLREKMRKKIEDEGRDPTITIESDHLHDMSFQRGIVQITRREHDELRDKHYCMR